MSDKVYTVQDYKSGQPRWCPGCGYGSAGI